MSLPAELLKGRPGIYNWCILSGYRGSVAHGMYIPNTDPHSVDDKDTMHVCVPTLEYYFGLERYGRNGTKEYKYNEWDVVVYEARKFISLLANSNPNVLSLLWLEDNHYITKSLAGQFLLDNRDAFTSKLAFNSFAGYARGQKKRMTRINDGTAYMGGKRQQLYKKFGYDCKNASHMIRLLRMGIEFLTTGTLFVKRKDAKELLQIKRGEWTFEQVTDEANRLFRQLEDAFIHSRLPDTVDRIKLNQISIEVVYTALMERNDLSL